MNIFKKIFKDESTKLLEKYQQRVVEIGSFGDTISKLSDEELKGKTEEFKERLRNGETTDDILPEAFAVVREASKRTTGLRHYDVQMLGGITIHNGNIAEMRTGEGKTLVATLPVYLNALGGEGVHVVTVNDYLARRDAVWMGQVYAFLGLSLSVINQESSFMYDAGHKEVDEERDEEGSYKVFYEFLKPTTRQEAYKADVTYGTNSEFGFDYLRDNLETDPKLVRQRPHAFALVDEIDSILIDEARTPLIISGPASDAEELYTTMSQVAKAMIKDEDYTVDEKLRSIHLTDDGINKAEKTLGIENIYTEKGIKYVHHLEKAVQAQALYTKDKEYVVRNNEVIIVDEFTGRMQPGRRWSDGLHQAIEAKEGAKIGAESRTMASITYQNYFRLYKKLSGMTGTAKTSAEEFLKVYGLDVVEIPTNKEIQRIDGGDLIFQSDEGKYMALAKEVKKRHEKGQPVLIGTVSIEMNEKLSAYLDKEGVKHRVLNAKNHENEGEIVASAGELGAVTIATNMAGRGVDIKLGGVNATAEEAEKVKEVGGLCVFGTERHDARRIDNQLRGRAGRQGDKGETRFFVSMDDKLMRVFASDTVRAMMSKLGLKEDEAIENKMITRSLENAQTRIEGMNFDARKSILEFDSVLNTQRKSVYSKRRNILMGDNSDIENEIQSLFGDDQEMLDLLKKKKEEMGEDTFYGYVKRIFLYYMDSLWVEHLETMEYSRSSVSLRAVGQREPVIEYKKEGKRLFGEMNMAYKDRVYKTLKKLDEATFVKKEERLQKDIEAAKKASGADDKTSTQVGSKIGRNEIVKIEKDGEVKEIKWKKAENLLEEGWKLVE